MTTTLGTRAVYVAAALAVLALGVIFVLASTGASQASSTTPAAQAVQGPLGTYSLFGRPAQARDNVSGWRMQGHPNGLGLTFSQARVVYQDGARAVAAVPSSVGPCLVSQFSDGSGALRCGDRDHISAVLSYNGAIGIVPDSVTSVTFTLTNGATQTQPVVGNIWRSPAEAAAVSFVLNGSAQTIELMPRSSLPRGATLHPDGMVTPSGT